MKKIYLLFLLISSSVGYAQWIPATGMDGAYVGSLIAKDSRFFCIGAGVGMERRTCNSEWSKFTSFDPYYYKSAGEYIFTFSPLQYPLKRSSDFGDTWDTVNFSYTGWNSTFTTVDSSLFIIANSEDGTWQIKRSDDYGDNWYDIAGNLTLGTINFIFSSNSTLMIGTLDPDHLYYSDNLGISWDSLPLTTIPGLELDYSSVWRFGTTFWLSSSEGTYWYDETLNSWILSTLSLDMDLYEFNSKLLGISDSGIYMHDEITDNWIQQNSGLETYFILSVYNYKDSLLLIGTDYGVYKSTYPISWEEFNEGLHGGNIYSVSFNGDTVWTCSSTGTYFSFDNGSTFQRRSYPENYHFKKIIITDSLYYGITLDKFLISDDEGISWTDASAGIEFVTGITDFGVGSDYIFLSGFTDTFHLFRTHHDPVSWELLSHTVPIATLAVHNKDILLGKWENSNYDYPVEISHDNCNTIDSLPCITNSCMPYLKYAGNRFIAGVHDKIFYSEDDGYNWVQISPETGVNVRDACTNGETFLVSGGFYFYTPYISSTVNEGQSWRQITDNITDAYTQGIDINGERSFLLTHSFGLWSRDDLLTGTSREKSPENRVLIYPNPSSGKIYIDVENEAEFAGNIYIIDILGKTVLESGSRIINIENLNKGIYIIIVKTGKGSYCGKVMKY